MRSLAVTILLGGLTVAACGDNAARTALDGGLDVDATDVEIDAAVPPLDANVPDPDAAVPPLDGNVPDPDAAVPDPDAAIPDPDAGVVAPSGDHCEDGVREPDELCLAAAPVIATPPRPLWLEAGDVDGNGLTDLVIPTDIPDHSWDPGTPIPEDERDLPGSTILYAQPGGGFVTAIGPGGPALYDLELADLDADGDLDVHIVAGRGSLTEQGPDWTIARNDGAAGFSPQRLMHLGWYDRLIAADLDGDDRDDAVLVRHDEWGYPASAEVYMSDGTTVAWDGRSYGVGSAYTVVIADLDDDGRPDLATADYQSLTIRHGNGDGTFAAPTTHQVGQVTHGLVVGDVDGDGIGDAVVAGEQLVVLPGVAGGGFAAPRRSPSIDAWAHQLADLDDDGHLDVVVRIGYDKPVADTTWVHFGNGDGTFGVAQPLAAISWSSAAVDADGDGRTDVVGMAAKGSVRLLRNLGARRFRTSTSLRATTLPFPPASARLHSYALAATDLDGDGHLDLATTVSGQGALVTLRGTGAGGFGPAESFTTNAPGDPRWPLWLVATDLDGDARPELISIADEGFSTGLVVARNDGAGNLHVETAIPGGLSREPVAIDLDGDGDRDIVSPDSLFTAINVFDNVDGVLQRRREIPLEGRLYRLAAGDVTGDGRVDLVAARELDDGSIPSFPDGELRADDIATRNVVLLRALAGGGYAAPETLLTGGGLEDVELADLDGDGDLDLVVAQPYAARVVVLGNQGGSFALSAELPVLVERSRPMAIATGDLDGDGHVDLAVADREHASVSVLLGRGDLSFPVQRSFGVNHLPMTLVIADVDGDGRNDLLVREIEHTISVLRGLAP